MGRNQDLLISLSPTMLKIIDTQPMFELMGAYLQFNVYAAKNLEIDQMIHFFQNFIYIESSECFPLIFITS